MYADPNHKEVIANDNDIKRQVPLITTEREKIEAPSQLMNEALFFRSTNK
jgi:hypothetical protein